MRQLVRRVVAGSCCLMLAAATVSAQRGRGNAPPPAEIAAPAIPGVIAPGTKVELVGTVARTEGPVTMPDGSLIFTNTNSITHVDLSGKISTLVVVSNGANGLGWDSHGRLIAVERKPNDEHVVVLYPPNAVTTLPANVDGSPFDRLNDLVVSS